MLASAVIIAGVIIAGAILLKDSTPRETPILPDTSVNAPDFGDIVIRPVSANEHIIGNKTAEVVVVEYSDTECPYCKVFHETMHKIIEENDDVAWVYRHYPIPELHPKAPREAEATECAWEQGGNTAFWKYIDRVFATTPSNNKLEDSELGNIAQAIGLNTSAFHTCLESGKYKNKVNADIEDGRNAQANGTPYSLILVNGQVVDNIPGAQPYEAVLERLNELTN